MKINEVISNDQIGVPTPSINDISKKHGYSITKLENELKKGIKVEQEHTDNAEMAKEIALDHLAELPDYYTRLDDMESEAGL